MMITCNGWKFIYNRFWHGVPFMEAAACIFSTQSIVVEDIKHSTLAEKRFNLISVSPKNGVLLVGFCKRRNGTETRIISARIASRKERKKYASKFGQNVIYAALPHPAPTFRMRFKCWRRS